MVADCSAKLVQFQSDCGARGTCEVVDVVANTTACKCDDLFTSVGDFAPLPGGACVLSVQIMQAMWAILLILAVPSLAISRWALKHRRRQQRRATMAAPGSPPMSPALKRKRRNATLRMVLIPFSNLVFQASVAPIAIAKLATGVADWAIGSSWPATVLHCVAVTSAMVALVCTLWAILRASMVEVRRSVSTATNLVIKAKFKYTRFAVFASAASFSLFAWVPIAMPLAPSAYLTITAVHAVGLAGTMFFLGVIVCPPFLSVLIKSVVSTRKGLEDDRVGGANQSVQTLKVVEKKLIAAWWLAFAGYGIQSIVVAIFGLMPLLVKLAGYLIPFEYICTSVAIMLAMWVTTTSSSAPSSTPGGPATGTGRDGAGGGGLVGDAAAQGTPGATRRVSAMATSVSTLLRRSFVSSGQGPMGTPLASPRGHKTPATAAWNDPADAAVVAATTAAVANLPKVSEEEGHAQASSAS